MGLTTSDFDFHLPEDRIALHPANPRDAARLLVVTPNGAPMLSDRIVRELPDLLRTGDALVVNDTRVIPAALRGRRVRDSLEAAIDLNLHRRVSPDTWRAFARPAKRLKSGDRMTFGEPGGSSLTATVLARGDAGEVEIRFDTAGTALDAAIAGAGRTPLPPYIELKRGVAAKDTIDYQTVYAAKDGAVAAPTAGLHFTPDLLARLTDRGITRHTVTLHVGAGTFLPVKTDVITDHKMHAEWGEITPETATAIDAVRQNGGRIVAVGTTVLRLLESAATPDSRIHPFTGETSIFITPDYRFRVVDLLMTNFHLPRSTLMMLVSAFAGLETMRTAYAHAIAKDYRFYSYGDASLLHRAA